MKIVYLSFDDGPHPATERILDVLACNGAKATFYLNGNKKAVMKGKEYQTVKRIIDGGHALGNHGYDHNPHRGSEYKKSKPSEVEKDFNDCRIKFEKLFKQNGGVFPGFTSARLPGHGRRLQAFTKMITHKVKLPHVGWTFEYSLNGIMPNSIPVKDWQGIKINKDKNKQTRRGVSASFKFLPANNSIILFHDSHWRTTEGMFLLAELVRFLKKKQYTFKALDPVPAGHPAIKYTP